MKCPVCDDVPLSISSREGVEIDFCPQCRGVWLDRGELDKILDRVAAVAPAPAGPPPSMPGPPPAAAPSYGDPSPPRYDDRPRYDERPRYDDRPHHDDRSRYDDPRYAKKKRKKSFLDDLFEFD